MQLLNHCKATCNGVGLSELLQLPAERVRMSIDNESHTAVVMVILFCIQTMVYLRACLYILTHANMLFCLSLWECFSERVLTDCANSLSILSSML